MYKLFRQQGSDSQQPGRFFILLYWLTSLIRLTEEEKDAAGIYVESQFDSRYKVIEKEQNGKQQSGTQVSK